MTMSRRSMLTDILPGAAIAIAGVTATGWIIAPKIADAMPLGIAKTNDTKFDEPVQRAQAVVVGRRRRRRHRWVCWWHRGHRACGQR
jgi:hypothetical protein